jgi:hypothetical protein
MPPGTEALGQPSDLDAKLLGPILAGLRWGSAEVRGISPM